MLTESRLCFARYLSGRKQSQHLLGLANANTPGLIQLKRNNQGFADRCQSDDFESIPRKVFVPDMITWIEQIHWRI